MRIYETDYFAGFPLKMSQRSHARRSEQLVFDKWKRNQGHMLEINGNRSLNTVRTGNIPMKILSNGSIFFWICFLIKIMCTRKQLNTAKIQWTVTNGKYYQRKNKLWADTFTYTLSMAYSILYLWFYKKIYLSNDIWVSIDFWLLNCLERIHQIRQEQQLKWQNCLIIIASNCRRGRWGKKGKKKEREKW